MCRRLPQGVPEAGLIRQRGSSQTLSKRRSVVNHEMGRGHADPVTSHTEEHKPKRRTQLACTRCRQRKIKCSGETTEGLGCEKCREAKNGDCVFLRAGSTLLETQQNTRTYRTHHSMMSSAPDTAMVPSPYGNSFVQSLPGAMTSSSSMSPMLDTARSQSVSDMSHHSPPSSWSRGPIYHPNSLIEDVYAAPYDSSSPAYVHTGSSSVSYSGVYHDFTASRAWEPASSGRRLQSAALYSEAVTTSASSYTTTSSMDQSLSASSDVPSLFPIVNMLSTGNGPIIGDASEQLASNHTSSSSVLGSITSTNVSELIGSGLHFMASEYFAYPMHRLNSTTPPSRPKSSSAAATVSPLTLSSDLNTSPFYVNNVPYDTSVAAAVSGPMTSVYGRSDTVEGSNSSQESLVMSLSAGLKQSPSESGSYEYANGEQYGSNSVEAEGTTVLENQQYGAHFKQSNNAAAAAVAYNAFGFLQSSAGPNAASNHEEH